jgi:hypothetical protein
VVLASPLRGAIQTRLSTAGSATGRANLAVLVAEGIVESPMLGYGDTRHARGSQDSITLGRTAVGGGCSQCGNADVGVNGQFWLLLYTNGIPAALFYVGFFVIGVWRFRRDRTPYGVAGMLVLLLPFVFMMVYTQLGPPLTFVILGYVLLWKNDRVLRGEDAPADEPAVPADRGAPRFPALSRPALPAGPAVAADNGTVARRREV